MLLGPSDDRPAPGDSILLAGTDLGSGSDTVVVHFDPDLTVPVPAADPQQISVVVPQGAKTGNVSITVTRHLPGNLTVVQDSNIFPIMVIWREFNTLQRLGRTCYSTDFGNYLLPGNGEEIGLLCGNTVMTISHDGSVSTVGNVSANWAQVAVNPVTGDVVGATDSGVISNGTTGEVLYRPSCPYWQPCSNDEWFPKSVGFDGEGNLIVLGNLGYHGHTMQGWRFAPGEPVILDVLSPDVLLPTEYNGDGWDYLERLAIGGDGAVYGVEWHGDWGPPYTLWRIPGRHSEPFEATSMPSGSGWDPGVWAWLIAADCRGEAYGLNPNIDNWGSPPFTLYRLSDNAPIATILDDGFVDGLNVDGFGNIFVELTKTVWTGSSYQRYEVIRRIMPEELPSDFYCPLSAASSSTPARATAATGDQCARCGPKRMHLKVEVIFDPDLPATGTNVTWLEDNGSGTASWPVLLGQSPTLTAWAVDPSDATNTTKTPVNATWQIVPGSETVNGAGERSLYPDRPEILFNDDPGLVRQSVQFQFVHFGTFRVTITPDSASRCDPLTIELDVTRPFGLGDTHHEYDPQIIDAANTFGIPPQYIKSQVKRESNFDRSDWRYEMRTWDEYVASKWTDAEWDRYGYFNYKLPQTSDSLLTNADISPRNRFQVITSFDWEVNPPTWPYATRPLTNADEGVSAWDLYEADDGWPCHTYAWNQYNPRLDCGSTFEKVGPTALTAPPQRQLWYARGELDWLNYYRAYGWVFYCGIAIHDQCYPPEANWLIVSALGHYAAQTPIASSYGLMQMGYITAVEGAGWNSGQGGETRHPSDLFQPQLNLALGTHYDAFLLQRYVFGDSSPTFGTLETYESGLRDGFGRYNGGPGNAVADYGAAVVANATNYKPY